MAYASEIIGSDAARGKWSTLIADLKAKAAQRRLFRQTYRELNSLSESELNDLGLNRTMLRSVAWQAVLEN